LRAIAGCDMRERNNELVRTLNCGFEVGDQVAILACLTDDLLWHVPPYFTAGGEHEFKAHITNPTADGPPVIDLRSLVAEGDIVTVEGFVSNAFKGGDMFRGLFHNIYGFRDSKVSHMTSYIVPLPETSWDSEATR
jgi:uncharacterized protein